jgi:ABC-2 type transport system permease protein
VRPYRRLLVAGFRRQSAYLAAAVGGLVANVTFGFLKAAILVATVEAAGGELAGYDAGSMLAYVWISQAMLGLVNVYGRDVLGERIRSGDVVVDFLRPLDLQLAGLATYLGERSFSLVPRGIPTFLVGLLVTGMALPATVLPYVLGAMSVVLGMTVSYLLVFVLNILGLWLVETRGIQVLYMAIAGFFSGLYVPVSIFPDWLETIARLTPFPSMLMTPVDVVTGRVSGLDSFQLVGTQLMWIAVVGGLGHLLVRAGRRHLEVQGG